jgi:tetratricopeptide (TPR) repeat protein
MMRACLLVVVLVACNGDLQFAEKPGADAVPLSAQDLDLMDNALSAMQARDYDKVRTTLQPLLSRNPAHADALFVAGSAAYELQMYGDTVRMLSDAIRAKPVFVKNSSALGFAHHKLGAFDEAHDAFAAIVAEVPGAYKAHYGLGLVALDQGRLVPARGHLERALALQPAYLKARFHTARLLHEEGRLEQARDALAAVVDEWPSHEEALYRYARVLAELGQEADAERVMARHAEVYAAKGRIGALIASQRAGQDSAELRQRIVALWLQLGELSEAHDACSAAAHAFPESQVLADLLERVASLR